MMVNLLKSFRTEINPTDEQKKIINRTIGVCRYIYNFYIAYNKGIYQQDHKFISGTNFSKWLNNEFIGDSKEHP